MFYGLWICCILFASAEFSCQHTFPDGAHVNLTALLRGPSDLNYIGSDVDGFKYTMNVCGVEASNVRCLDTDSMICEFNPNGSFRQSVARWGVGQAPEWSRMEGGQGVVLKFNNGDVCTDSEGKTGDSVALLAFTCSSVAGEAFTVGHMNPCVYTITFPTVHACTTASTVGFGAHSQHLQEEPAKGHSWGITSLLMIGLMCYCCVGCLWRFKHKDARGLDMVPHLSFWSGLVNFVKDLCEQSVAIVRHRVEKFRSGRHETNSQYEEVETIPFDDTDNNL